MSVPFEPPNVEFGDESRPPETVWLIWMRKKTILAATAIVVGLTLLHLSQRPAVYVSSAEVLIRFGSAKPGGVEGYQSTPNMEPPRRMATSAAVRSEASRRLGSPGPPPGITVTAPRDTYTLLFSASSPSAVMAQRTVTAYVDSYVHVRWEAALKDLADARAPIEKRLAEVSQDVDNTAKGLLGAPENERQALQTRLSALLNERQTLEQTRNGLTDPRDRQVAEVLQPATLPESPVGPKKLKYLSFATALGSSLGIGIALAASLLSPRVQGRRAVTAEVSGPVLSLIRASRRSSRHLVVTAEPESRRAEEYQVLAATLQRIIEQDELSTLLVTSPNRREGKSSTAANLAAALARAGTQTVIFSGNRRNGIEAFPDVGDETIAQGASQLHDPTAVRLIVENLSSSADFVIFDGPPVLGHAEVLVIAQLVDAVIVVAAADRTTTGTLREASARLELVGANIVGTVLTGVSHSRIWFERRFNHQDERRVVGRSSPERRSFTRVRSTTLDEPLVG